GAAALAEFRLAVGRPLAPMLAASAPTVDDALAGLGTPVVVDVKLDGVRIQVHRSGDEVAVFTRSLDDVTGRMPEVVAAARQLAVREVVLDGEAILEDASGRPRPFQETSSRVAQRRAAALPLTPYFFDVLHLDGTDLIDAPGRARWTALAEAVPGPLLVARAMAHTVEQAGDAFAAAVDAGHEGVVIKDPDAPYDVGRRGG